MNKSKHKKYKQWTAAKNLVKKIMTKNFVFDKKRVDLKKVL